MEQLLTTKQAAKIIGILQMTVIHAIRRGSIKATRFGNSYAIPETEVMRYAENHGYGRWKYKYGLDEEKFQKLLAECQIPSPEAFKAEREKKSGLSR